MDQLEQCAHDAYQQAVAAQKGEGCRMWGRMQVRVVRVALGRRAWGRFSRIWSRVVDGCRMWGRMLVGLTVDE